MRLRGILGKLRREQDSNLRTGFAGYTLSRRASSTTRAPLQNASVERFAAAKLSLLVEKKELFARYLRGFKFFLGKNITTDCFL